MSDRHFSLEITQQQDKDVYDVTIFDFPEPGTNSTATYTGPLIHELHRALSLALPNLFAIHMGTQEFLQALVTLQIESGAFSDGTELEQ